MTGTKYYRKVIRITAEDSPNVKFARWQERNGLPVTNEIIVPGVLPWDEYQKRRTMWDPVRQSIGLDAQFWVGADLLLYPPQWLNLAEQVAKELEGKFRKALSMGVDSGEGGANTCWAIGDEWGLIKLISMKTPDTSIIPKYTKMLIEEWKLPPERVLFDRGGGGKQWADLLKNDGYHVRTVAFGEAITQEPRRGMTSVEEKREQKAEHYVYKNRRAQMYGEPRELLQPGIDGNHSDVWKAIQVTAGNPARNTWSYGIPAEYSELRRQLSLMPYLLDGEGRMYLPPKNKKSPDSTEETLIDILGASPDEADAFVLMIHGLIHRARIMKAGAAN